MKPCLIVVCRRCGHEEGAGSSLMRFPSPEDQDEDETARAARAARERAEARVQRWYENAITLRGLMFPVYAAQSWPARISGSGSSGDDLTEITIGHHAEDDDDPFAAPDFEITTARADRHDRELRHAQQRLEGWVDDDDVRSCPDDASDAAIKLWFAARARERRRVALRAVQATELITVDGTPLPFLTLSAPNGRRVAIRRHADLSITIAARGIDLSTLILEPLANPAARLLGPEPEDPAAA